jgi:AcrR family transcriptional regulator
VKGAKDLDYPEKRAALVARLRVRLARADGDHPSFRQLAEFAEVSQATLRHYFGNSSELIAAVIATHAAEGAPYLAHIARPSGSFEDSIAAAIEYLANGQRQPSVRAIHTIGSAEGVRRSAIGDAYRSAVLDPVFRAIEERLDSHVRAGDMRACDTRAAAIALCAPVLLFFQHQADFGGESREPMDFEAFADQHVEGFVRGYRAEVRVK